MASAELFALAGVRILNSLGIVDYLSFGSESGDLSLLERTADAMMSEAYETELSRLISASKSGTGGYPQLCELALRCTLGEDAEYAPLTPNNILALEYIKALRATSSTIQPHTIKREGADFGERTIVGKSHQSATAIRTSLLNGDHSALEFIPILAKDAILSAIAAGEFAAFKRSFISRYQANDIP